MPEETRELFHPSKVPSERMVSNLKLLKLLFYGLTAVIPVTGLLLSVPFLQSMQGYEQISAAILIPFFLLLISALLFAFVNGRYNRALQLYAAYKALKPVLEALPVKPRRIEIVVPTLGESLVLGVGVKEFILTFPSNLGVPIYYTDGAVTAKMARFVGGPSKFYGLRIRTYAPLKKGKPGRFERFGSVYLPFWGFTPEVQELEQRLKGRVSFEGLELVTVDPEPSRIDFELDRAVISLTLKQGAQEMVWQAVQKVFELHRLLREEGIIE